MSSLFKDPVERLGRNRRSRPAAWRCAILRCLRSAAAVPLVRVRLAVPVRRLALAVAVARRPAAVAQLPRGVAGPAEVARPHELEQRDGGRVPAKSGLTTPHHRLRLVGLHAFAHHNVAAPVEIESRV
jgi:hypothetical protein